MTNLFDAFTGRAVGTNLGSAFQEPRRSRIGPQQTYPVAVPAGVESLRATIGSPGVSRSRPRPLRLQLHERNLCPRRTGADGDSEESVTITNPAAGPGWSSSTASGSPRGHDVQLHRRLLQDPAVRAISVTDANALRPAGSSWTAPASVTALYASPGTSPSLWQRQRGDGHECACRPGRRHHRERHALGSKTKREEAPASRGPLRGPKARCSRGRRAERSRDCRGRRSPARRRSRSGRRPPGTRPGTHPEVRRERRASS